MRRDVLRSIVVILAGALLAACTSTVSRPELLESMRRHLSSESSHINILWYRGTKDHFHYVSHVYRMFGSKDYRIADSELRLPAEEIIPLTSDDTKWKLIRRIGTDWEASRKDLRSGLWLPDREGALVVQ
jgi:hypothetical protein